MDQNKGNRVRETIQKSELSEDAKSQLLPLVDFLDNPEVKQRFLEILQIEEDIIDIKLQHVKDLQSNLLHMGDTETPQPVQQ